MLPLPYQVSITGADLGFTDAPVDSNLPVTLPSTLPKDGTYIAFRTSLVGVSQNSSPGALRCDPTQTASTLYCTTLYVWTWNTTFNGKAGGISQTASLYPPDPGSGTGGVTITNINGVQLPAVLLPSQVSVVASGLAYSRVSQTFNGTVTLTNISGTAITGPLQILFFGVPANVTLMNATSSLSGTPYLTVPAVTSLAPGQSATVSVQFKNPSNAAINSTPVIYSGSIN